MLNNIMFATVYVTDQDRALEFYTQKLGLQLRFDNPQPDGRFLTVSPPGSQTQIMLAKLPSAAGQSVAGEPGRVPGVIFLQSDDLRKDVDAMRDRGVTFEQAEPEDYEYGVLIEALDPDGNRISLRQITWTGSGGD